jgi:lipopolysaccharide biosynthesis glycosyltransferase
MSQKALVFCLDANYLMPFKVAIHSLLEFGEFDLDIPIFILYEEKTLPFYEILELDKFLSSYKIKVEFLDCSNKIPDDLPLTVTDHVSRAAFHNLFISSILPSETKFAVYLDCDIIVIGSLRYLFDIELIKPLAAVDDFSPTSEIRVFGKKGINYFNNGVMVLDLERLRFNKFENTFIEILANDRSRIKYWDQDVLNIAFHNNWQKLPIWFNVHENIMDIFEEDKIMSNAHLLHFDGSNKPWKAGVKRKLQKYWFDAYSRFQQANIP